VTETDDMEAAIQRTEARLRELDLSRDLLRTVDEEAEAALVLHRRAVCLSAAGLGVWLIYCIVGSPLIRLLLFATSLALTFGSLRYTLRGKQQQRRAKEIHAAAVDLINDGEEDTDVERAN
jgi:Flp pilus assembly protein TadB